MTPKAKEKKEKEGKSVAVGRWEGVGGEGKARYTGRRSGGGVCVGRCCGLERRLGYGGSR